MDPYAELGISPDASSDEIKSAYRRLAKQYHPDSNPENSDHAEKMNRINEAYSMLREGRYDLDLGEEWYREQYEEAGREEGILYHPLFSRVILIGIAVSMVVVGIAAAFFSALRV